MIENQLGTNIDVFQSQGAKSIDPSPNTFLNMALFVDFSVLIPMNKMNQPRGNIDKKTHIHDICRNILTK